MEGERDTANGELITARVEATRAQGELEKEVALRVVVEEQVTTLGDDKDRLENNLAQVRGGVLETCPRDQLLKCYPYVDHMVRYKLILTS